MSFQNLIFVFIGGGAGACLRFFVSSIFSTLNMKLWLATLLVNILGTLFIFLGQKLNYFETSMGNHLLKIGVLGGLTTFSTFSLELVTAYRSGNLLEAFLILGLNIAFGIVVGTSILR